MQRSSTFETGVNGVAFDVADPGSPDQFQAITGGGNAVYSTDHPHSPVLGVKWPNTITIQHIDWTGLGSLTGNVWARFYIWVDALPGDNNWYPFNFRTSANAAGGSIRVLTTGKLQMRDSANSQIGVDSSVSLATGQLVRIEVRQNTGAGEMEYWLYNTADSSTADDTGSATGASLGANTDRANFGHNVANPAAGVTSWWDDLAVSDVAKIGAYALTVSGTVRENYVRHSRRTSW